MDVMLESREKTALIARLLDSEMRGMTAIRQQLIEEESIADGLDSDQFTRAEEQMRKWREAGFNLVTWFDEDYPEQFRDVHDFPPFIFTRGTLLNEDYGIAIVGSRNAPEQHLRAASDIARRLVADGVTVVSGLAAGVDTVAHETALRLGGRTVAVLGTGIDRYYPACNRLLQETIESRGLTLSQFLPGTPPTKRGFPMRNAVMSAYARATIIVSAEENSGTRHQARQALIHGRPIVLSRPVAEGTSWGRELANDPTALVGVADGSGDAIAKLNELIKSTRVFML